MKRPALRIYVLLGLLGAMFASATPTTNGPSVLVQGTRIGGGTIICRGEACAGVLSSMMGSPVNHVELPPLADDGSVAVSGPQFCANLRAAKPSGCNASNPPPSPGIYVPGRAPFEANGCGTGRLSSLFADVALEIIARPTYSGDFQAPYPGVSFAAACNAHDTCWAAGSMRSVCDYNFRSDMIAACGGDHPSNNTCLGFSGIYHGAVTNTGASLNAYNSSVAERACAVWASDVRENQC